VLVRSIRTRSKRIYEKKERKEGKERKKEQRKRMSSVRKKVDARIKTLIENGIKTRHRSFFVVVGDKARDQVVNLHYMLSKASVRSRPTVLWCYKKELGFSSAKQKRMKQIKKQMKKGLFDPDKDDPFELFVSSTTIRYTYYSETHKILGNTYGMCVLQDFEAITPNLLARTIETVEVKTKQTQLSMEILVGLYTQILSLFREVAWSCCCYAR